MRTIVVGLGNPILSDDSVGIKAAALARVHLAGLPGVEVAEAYAGGLRLMEAIAGFDRAVIVDAVKTGKYPAGTLLLFQPGRGDTRNLLCAHDSDLETSLGLGRELGLHLPDEIHILGVEAYDVENFSEELSCRVQAALPAVVAEVVRICRPQARQLFAAALPVAG
jgi:hydrogenase maturation protease